MSQQRIMLQSNDPLLQRAQHRLLQQQRGTERRLQEALKEQLQALKVRPDTSNANYHGLICSLSVSEEPNTCMHVSHKSWRSDTTSASHLGRLCGSDLRQQR